MLDQLNEEAARLGGTWLKLARTTDPKIDGIVVAFEVRDKTFKNEVVLSRTSGQPRKEWLFTLTVTPENAEDDGLRKWSANESAQRAIAAAIRESGVKAAEGARLQVAVTKDPPDSTSQAEYAAKWTPGAAPLAVPAEAVAGATEAVDPFADDAPEPF